MSSKGRAVSSAKITAALLFCFLNKFYLTPGILLGVGFFCPLLSDIASVCWFLIGNLSPPALVRRLPPGVAGVLFCVLA